MSVMMTDGGPVVPVLISGAELNVQDPNPFSLDIGNDDSHGAEVTASAPCIQGCASLCVLGTPPANASSGRARGLTLTLARR